MAGRDRKRVSRTLGGMVLGAAFLSPHSVLANDANVVLYNQHTAEKGETEIEVFSDFANVGSGEPNYTAQLFELEHGLTDLWTSALYLEGAKTEGENYDYGSFRFENRVRLYKDVTFLNPVLYSDYRRRVWSHATKPGRHSASERGVRVLIKTNALPIMPNPKVTLGFWGIKILERPLEILGVYPLAR